MNPPEPYLFALIQTLSQIRAQIDTLQISNDQLHNLKFHGKAVDDVNFQYDISFLCADLIKFSDQKLDLIGQIDEMVSYLRENEV